ncbi:MAG: ankyrin repeat domain-containing protein [Acidobacteriaceae bacterium]|nr:ankyrin repeat domain-containing protein [Acidobacteriaceae bacterium]
MADVKAFQEQVKKGDLAAVRAALAEEPVLLDATNEAGQTSFLLAKYYRQSEVADYLLGLHPKLSIFDRCVAGQTESVLEQIDQEPALLEAHSSDGWTPLHLAAFFGRVELAKGLLNRGAVIGSRSTNAMKNTPLHAAAAGGQLELVKVLLDYGADANARQHGGWTALHSAAQAGNRGMAEILLARGADVSARADNNQSALDLALMHAHGEMATLLEGLEAQRQ